MSTTGRILELLSLLQRSGHWSGAELAARLEVSERTLRRDVERLRDLGYPVEATPGVDGGYRLAAGTALPPLVLDDEEAVALVVGLRSAAHSGVSGVAEASVRALAKAVEVLPGRLRRRAEDLSAVTAPAPWGEAPPVDATVLTVLAQAARNTEQVELDYVDAAGNATHRRVEPHRVVMMGRRWYLAAWDLSRHDWRTLRLDRITSPSPTGRRYPSRELPAGDPVEYVRQSVTGATAPTHDIVAVVQLPASQVENRIGRWARAEPIDEETCRVHMTADNLAWPIMALGSLEADFQVESPEELKKTMTEWSKRFQNATSG